MKLKTRGKLAWLELILSVSVLAGMTGLDVIRPRFGEGLSGTFISVLLTASVFGWICYGSWKRLSQTRAQLVALGPDAEPRADLWTAPGALGMIGVLVILVAVAVALTPALLQR
jgi:hypothetical protein